MCDQNTRDFVKAVYIILAESDNTAFRPVNVARTNADVMRIIRDTLTPCGCLNDPLKSLLEYAKNPHPELDLLRHALLANIFGDVMAESQEGETEGE